MPITYIGAIVLVVAAGAVSFSHTRRPTIPLVDLAVAFVGIGCALTLVLVVAWLAWES